MLTHLRGGFMTPLLRQHITSLLPATSTITCTSVCLKKTYSVDICVLETQIKSKSKRPRGNYVSGVGKIAVCEDYAPAPVNAAS